jgi:hypothetical protein
MQEATTPELVAGAIEALKCTRIGIDGTHGVGKSTLARAIATRFDLPLFSLDDYLAKGQGGFLDFIDYHRLNQDLGAVDRYIIEGVCLIEVLKRVNVTIQCLVYVKRMQHGLWADEQELEIQDPVEDFLEKEKQLTEMISCDGNSDLALDEEVIRYHEATHPQNCAHIIFLRADDDR